MTGAPLDFGLWAAAAVPVVLLFALVASGKVRAQAAAFVVLAVAMVIAGAVFRLGWIGELVAVAKGLWLGLWILFVVWPALLLYRIASTAGLERIGDSLASVLPERRDRLLLVSWLLPGFVQGVAGFGTPIAIAAPLLVALGYSRKRAVLYPLIGYHWAVTFGSMGSSFYMASLTAQVSSQEQFRFALLAASLLGVNVLLAGAFVLLLDGGWSGLRDGWPTVLRAGVPVAATLVATAAIVPAVATLTAGAVGLLVISLHGNVRRRAAAPAFVQHDRQPLMAPAGSRSVGAAAKPPGVMVLFAPYGYLLATALPVLLVPRSRAWVADHVILAFDFPSTVTGWGWTNPAVSNYSPIAVFNHPGFYILLSCVLGYLTYRRCAIWPPGAEARVARTWARSLPKASWSILLLAALASVLIDAGMISVLAQGITALTGSFYPVLSPWLGAVGSFMTGSTTTSNALFAALQGQAADFLGISTPILLAAQTAGGNVGNALAPVVILVGATAVEDLSTVPAVLRAAVLPAVGLLIWLSIATALLAA